MKLDHIENIEIHPGISPLLNFHSIPQLLEGIFMMYKSMKNLEKNYWNLRYPNETEETLKIYKSASISISGELTKPDAQAVNLYHWYSINLINYAKCCGLVKFLNKKHILPEYLAGNKELIKELKICQDEYLKSIEELKPVMHFRNKASAHLAFTDPRKNDNPATLVESMSIIPTLMNGKIIIGGMTRSVGDHESSFAKHEWNLIDNFNSLIPRYFVDYIN